MLKLRIVTHRGNREMVHIDDNKKAISRVSSSSVLLRDRIQKQISYSVYSVGEVHVLETDRKEYLNFSKFSYLTTVRFEEGTSLHHFVYLPNKGIKVVGLPLDTKRIQVSSRSEIENLDEIIKKNPYVAVILF